MAEGRDEERSPDDRGDQAGPTESLGAQGAPAERIGDFQLLRMIGEGGMGEVWLAEQKEPVRRKVALKIIKRGMDTREVIARFEAERQALALMDHHVIARVFDAGQTAGGRPYFVMEHVKGVPITEHCDRQRLTTRERLELFLEVCEGVQHAHQKAVIHRDLKPSNVLVALQDGRAVVKIIDFGVAKATAQQLTEKTFVTELGMLIGTPEYMSPEQAEMTGQDVDTRTDVYSLGMMLYELLVGALPFDARELRAASFPELVRRIREDEPSRPSTRLSTLGEQSTDSARKRSTELPALRRELSGDLDWITLKALEKDRSRRYGSPHELAADIRRHLDDLPVSASPPSTAYRARKFVRRHKVGVGAAVAAVATLTIFAAAMAVQAGRVTRERDRADEERQAAERVSGYLADMIGGLDPQELGRSLREDLLEQAAAARAAGKIANDPAEIAALERALEAVNPTDTALRLLDERILSRAAEAVTRDLADDPLIAARLEHTLGETYRGLGLYERAEPHALRAVEIRAAELGGEHPDTLSSMHALAILYWVQGRYVDAEKLQLETLGIRKRVLGEEHPDTLASAVNLTAIYALQQRTADAQQLLVSTLEIQRRVLGDRDVATLNSMHNLSSLYARQGRFEQATRLREEVLAEQRRTLGPEHPRTLASMNNLAVLYRDQGLLEEAESWFLEVLRARERVHGGDHPNTLASVATLSSLYEQQERYREAEALLESALGSEMRAGNVDAPIELKLLETLAGVYEGQRRPEKARELMRRCLAARRSHATESGDPAAAIEYARSALTCRPADLRDPADALDFAIAANEKSGYGNPAYLDILALAQHLAGDTSRAIETELLALSLLPDDDVRTRTRYERRLAELRGSLESHD
jgi:non-specific serine/threonine protein kinase/serine/threonine-protein kinase